MLPRLAPLRLRLVLSACLLLLAATPPQPDQDDGSVPDPVSAALEAWEQLKETRVRHGRRRAAARAAWEASERTEADRVAYLDARTEFLQEAQQASDAFLDAFAGTDWKGWDLDAHAPLVEEGVFLLGRRARDAQPAAALEAWSYYLELFGDRPRAGGVRRADLPIALLAALPPREAASRIAALAEELAVNDDGSDDRDVVALRVHLGDAHAIRGDLDAARRIWNELLGALPEELESGDPRAAAQRDALVRLRLVGEQAPEIGFSYRVGAAPRALSELRGGVVVLAFCATWCGPSRGVMPGLNALYQERRDEGLVLLGVTRYYDRGFLVEDPVLARGTSISGIAEEDFPAHLARFRERGAIDYPFVVADKAAFEAYGVTGIPAFVVVDRDGLVRYVAAGGGQESVLRTVVEHLLAG